MFGTVIVDVIISCRSFVFGQSRAKVSASFTNVSSLAVAAFDLKYCLLSVLRFVFVLDISVQQEQSAPGVQHVYCKVVVYVR